MSDDTKGLDQVLGEQDAAATLLAGELIGLRYGVPRTLDDDGRPYTLVPDGVSLHNLEGYLLNPVLRRADVALYDAASFVAYVNRFKDDASVIFSDKIAKAFTAVLDYHEGADGFARWGRHRVMLQARQTEAWKRWVSASKTPMNQATFAAFLEDNVPDIAEPEGAKIVEAARNLEAKKAVAFQSHQRPHDGSVHFLYSEDVQGHQRGGELKIPEQFILGIAPFEGSAKYRVTARVRFRIEDGGKLAMWFDLYRVEDIVEQAYADMQKAVADGVSSTLILSGPAPAKATAE